MNQSGQTLEHFPLPIVFISNLVTVSVYAIGAFILSGFGTILPLAYLLYCTALEITLLRRSCVNCCYYGKVCGFGKGKLCSVFFARGEPDSFARKTLGWKDLIPDFLVSIIPLAGGLILLLRNFSWPILSLLAGLVVLAFPGSALIRGALTCRNCKQREIGCPAEQLFRREKQAQRS